MSKTTFANRLKQACDRSDVVPPYGAGRQVAIATKLGVTQEAVRKYFSGEATPRPEKMRVLAEYLGEDEAWLALGVKPELDKTTRRRHRAKIDGAIYLVAGQLMLEGGQTAFPAEDSPQYDLVDVYAIIHGTQAPLHVCLGFQIDDETLQFNVPQGYEEVRCIGVVSEGPGRWAYLDLRDYLLEGNLRKHAGDYVVRADVAGSRYSIGGTPVVKSKTLGELL